MKVKNCPKCGSLNFVKKGFNLYKNDKIQRYFSKDCNCKFQPKIEVPLWVKKAYKDYIFKGMIFKDLTVKYNKSIPTLTKYFDILNEVSNKPKKPNKSNSKQFINLIFDATFFKRRQFWKIYRYAGSYSLF